MLDCVDQQAATWLLWNNGTPRCSASQNRRDRIQSQSAFPCALRSVTFVTVCHQQRTYAFLKVVTHAIAVGNTSGISAGNGETSSVNFCSTRAAAALYVSNFPATEYTASKVPLAR